MEYSRTGPGKERREKNLSIFPVNQFEGPSVPLSGFVRGFLRELLKFPIGTADKTSEGYFYYDFNSFTEYRDYVPRANSGPTPAEASHGLPAASGFGPPEQAGARRVRRC
jgi:hypothetical protein